MPTSFAPQKTSDGDIHGLTRAFLVWRDDWLVNIQPVDEEHKELARLLNRIAECVLYGGESSEDGSREGFVSHKIHQLLDALGEHTRKHFKNEERLMRETDYPELNAHYNEHVTLLAEFAELMRDIRMNGLACLDMETLQGLKEWLLSHIVGADLKFGDYYHGKRKKPEFAQER